MRGKLLIFGGIIFSQTIASIGMVLFLTKGLFPASIADNIIVLCEVWNTGLVLGNAMVLLSFFDLRDSFNPTIVLMFPSKTRMLSKQLRTIMLNASLISLILVLSGLFWGNLVYEKSINWGEAYSYFALNYKATIDNVSLWNVIIHAFAGTFIIMLLIGLFCIVAKWYGIKPIIVFEFITIDCVVEWISGKRILLRNMTIRHPMWIDSRNYVVSIVTVCIACVVAIVLLRLVLKNKEFI